MVSPAKQRLSIALLAAVVLAAIVAGLLAAADSVPLDPDALVRESLCRRLVLGTTEGRQGLVSSVWFAPLPTLARLPLVYLLPDSLTGLPSRLISLLFGLAALVVLGRTAFRWCGAAAASLVVLGLAAHPAFITACLDGSDATTIAAFILLCAASWSRWVLEDRLTHLSLMSLAAALLCLTRFEMLGWAAAGFVLVLLHESAAPRLRGQRQAILILGLLPWAYGLSLWIMGNWLIMGDALYFLRGLGEIIRDPARPSMFTLADPAWLIPLAFPLLLLPAAILKKEYAAFSLVTLTLAAGVLAALLHLLGCLWDSRLFLLPLLALCLLSLARLAGLIPARLPSWRKGVAATSLAVPLLLLALRPEAWQPGAGAPPPLREEQTDMLAQIKETVEGQTPFGTIYVCGYEAFPMLDGNRDPRFIRELDFDFTRAQREYEGHTLFLLVPRPEGRGDTESIHRKFPGIYAAGFANTLHYGDWGRWRLFELVDNPREEEP